MEHAFRDAWKQYNNCLKQRNSLLRAGRIDRLELAFWDKQIVSFGEQVTEQRKAFLAALVNACSPILRHLLEGHVDVAAISLQLKQGWDKNKSLEEALALQLEKDCDKRFTQLGPHRADLSISVDNKPADQWLSRGQQKLLIVSMYLAQVALIQGAAENKIATVLLDDLSAELDQTSITKLLAVLRECGSQVVVTSVDDRLASMQANGNADDAKVFHVEHGNVSERV